MTKEILISRIKDGNSLTFKKVFECYYEPLVAYITTFTHNRQLAKDIVQDCFLILWVKRETLADNTSIKNYLYTLAYHKYIDFYRKNKFKNTVLNELKFDALSHRINESEYKTQERIHKLKILINKLPPRCKEILLLNKVEGKKYKEIADILGVSIKTVESQMRIAFKKIREGFKSENIFIFLFKKFKSIEI